MTRLAVVGATGLVGTKILETPIVNISNLMSWYYSHQQRSAGKEIEFQGKHIQFKNLQKKQQVKI